MSDDDLAGCVVDRSEELAALNAALNAALALQVQRARDDALEELVALAQQIGFLSVEDIRAFAALQRGR